MQPKLKIKKCGDVVLWFRFCISSSCHLHRLPVSICRTLPPLPHSHSACSSLSLYLSPSVSLCLSPRPALSHPPSPSLSHWQVINEQAAVGEEASAAWISNGTVDPVGLEGGYHWSVPQSTKCTTLCVHITHTHPQCDVSCGITVLLLCSTVRFGVLTLTVVFLL